MIKRLIGLIFALVLVGTSFGQIADQAFFAPNRWAVVIGASEYPALGKLEFAAADAELFAKTLIGTYQFDANKVSVLTDKEDSALKPTVENINKTLDRILTDPSLTQGDLLVFYFSGHGAGIAGTDLLLPTDATPQNFQQVGLPVKSILDRMAKSGVQNIIFVADACRSGQENPFGDELIKLGREANIAILLACSPGGRSYELSQLGHGAFTYSLTKAMKDSKLRDNQTGALWASTIAEIVQTEVQTVTAKDQGEQDKQVPSIWCRKNQDILLGGYMSAKVYDDLKQSAGDLAQDVYIRNLYNLAVYSAEQGNAELATTALRTIRQLDKQWGASLALEAVSLDRLGRGAESNKVFAQMVKEFPDDYHSMLYRALYTVGHEARQRAAWEFWNKTKTVDAALALMLSYRFDPFKTEKDMLGLFDEYLKHFDPESGPYSFFQAYKIGLTEDPVKLLEDAEIVEIPDVRHEYVEMLFYDIALRSGDPQLIFATIQKIMVHPSSRTTWEFIERPWAIRLATEDNRDQLAKELLANAGSSERLWTAVLVWGYASGEHYDEIIELAKKFPFSIRAQEAVWYAKLMKDLPEELVVPEELLALGFEQPYFMSEAYEQLALSLLEPWAIFHRSDKWQTKMVQDLLKFPSPQDEQWWRAIYFNVLGLGREDIMTHVIDTVDASKYLTLSWLDLKVQSELNRGQIDKAIDAIHKMHYDSSPMVREIWNYVIGYCYLHGRVKEAVSLKEEALKMDPGAAEEFVSLEVLQHAIEGHKADVERLTETLDAQSPIYFYQEWARYKVGLSTLEQLKAAILQGKLAYPWAHAALVRQYAEGAKLPADIDFITNYLGFMVEPIYQTIAAPVKNEWASELPVKGVFSPNVGKELTFTGKFLVQGTGATLEITLSDGSKLVLAGKMTGTGSFDLQGDWQGQKASVKGRTPPTAWWLDHKESFYQLLILTDKGEWADILIQPS